MGFVYAAKGISYAFKSQVNFKIEIFIALAAIIISFILKISFHEFLWIILSIAIVLIAELLNTAIEILVDFVSPGYHEKAGRIKDISAGLVLVAAIASACIGAFIFLPKLF
ncbi:diacylglycerol kinase [Pedobacter sp. HMF7647]|uniref:Diacylglycerol kinase n=1 Tax=Hufsiella arboris TaxID=2695275 RepID=A0A7K1YAK8_9SPHI|nr:diacylglycerol kinase family protein [Hufsiella arboris]MXV51098.1 diacylglycerol kinase [Hufsiella arboris]